MEMFRSFRGDKQEFCLAVIKFKHVFEQDNLSTLLQSTQL